MLACRGVRGATAVRENSRSAIIEATQELLLQLVATNQMDIDDVASVFFTTTPDVTAAFPAIAARELGWTDLAMLCGHEMHVPGSLPLCIRVLILWNTDRSPRDIVHCYLGDAACLRPERAMSVSLPSAWMPVA